MMKCRIVKALLNLFFSLAILAVTHPILSAQKLSFKNFSIEDGLPQSQVFEIFQDKKGYLWICTNGGGLSRFDGLNFVNFTQKEGLLNNVVRTIAEDGKGRLWIGTDQGLCIMDGTKFISVKDTLLNNTSVRDIFIDSEQNVWIATYGHGLVVLKDGKYNGFSLGDNFSENKIECIKQDKNKNLWIGTIEGGLVKFDGKGFEYFNTVKGLPNNNVRSVIADSKGVVWAGTDNGLVKIENSNATVYNTRQGLVNNLVYEVFEDSRKNLWIGTFGGISRFDGRKFVNYTTKEGLSSDFIYHISEDREGNLWIGTYMSGISMFSGNKFSYYTEESGLKNNFIASILEDKDGNIWFGSMGGGVSIYDGKNYKVLDSRNGLTSDNILALMQEKKGDIWISTLAEGVLRYDGKKFKKYGEKELKGNTVFAMIQDRTGNIWLGTKGLTQYDGTTFTNYSAANGFVDRAVFSLYEDSKGNIWVGTYGKGVFRFDGKNFTQITPTDGLPSGTIYCITEDADNNIWLGTEGWGICKLERKKNKYSVTDTITVKDGLSMESVQLLTLDDEGNLWAGTSKGIDKLNLSDYKKKQKRFVTNYGKDEGFLTVECNQNAIFKDDKGNLYFGTVGGAIRFNPKEDNSSRSLEPLTHITKIKLFLEDTDWKTFSDSVTTDFKLPYNLSLPFNKNYLTFDFIGINYTNPNKVKYQFILKGFSQNWSPVTSKTEATYSNLPPGTYTFAVRASNYSGIWNKEPASFTFTILKPFWQRTWFYILIFLLGVLIIYGFIALRTRSLRQIQKNLEKKVRKRTEQLLLQNNKLSDAYKEIEYKNLEITDSIRYAKKIQEAILPPMELVKSYLPESFVFFMPKDIVSGDFYWLTKKGGKIVIAAVDCTGHGVPGAFMSFVGFNLLNQIVNQAGVTKPSDILNQLNLSLNESLRNTTRKNDIQDGMDIALCTIDTKNLVAEFAGAHNPLYHVRNNELTVLPADRFPVGSYVKNEERLFSNKQIELKKGDSIYLFSDGFADQFGGADDRKFMYKRFRQLFLNIQEFNMAEQKIVLYKEFSNWKKQNQQIDDILIIGVKV